MLKFVILLCCSIACILGAVLPEGLVPRLDGRIVGGDTTEINLFPWQISVQRNGYHICGGAIYNSLFIISAAHCFKEVQSSALSIRAGSSFWRSGGIAVGVASYVIHEGYNARTSVNDIAIVRLSSSLTMSSTIKPIPLATTTPPNGALATVSGWGRTSYGGTSSSQLRYVNLEVVGLSKCSSSTYGYGNNIKKHMLCTYAVEKDACQGDSGGPLVSGGALVGIVSWGYGCAHPKYPGVYSDVADFRSWIISTVSTL